MDDILAKKNRHLFLEEKDNTHNSFISNINYAVENIDTIKTFNDNVNSGTMQHLLETYIEQVGTEGNAWVVKLTELGENILATTSGFSYASVLIINQDIEAGATITLPEAMKYRVGTHMLLVSWNGTVCYNGEQYEEVGAFNESSTIIKIKQDIKTGDKLEFRTVALADATTLVNELNEIIDNTSVTATNSTEKRTLSNRFADVVNVKDFGAKGDGVLVETTSYEEKVKPVVLILAGQSNAVGSSGELTSVEVANGGFWKNSTNSWVKGFAEAVWPATVSSGMSPRLADSIHSITNRPVYIINVAVGSTIAVSSSKNSIQRFESWAEDGSLRIRAKGIINAALKSFDEEYDIIGTVWLQGETDASGINLNKETIEDYAASIPEIIHWFLDTYGGHFFAIPIAYNANAVSTAGVDAINDALENAVEANTSAVMATNITKTFLADGYVSQDGVHYTQEGYDILGQAVGTYISAYITPNKKYEKEIITKTYTGTDDTTAINDAFEYASSNKKGVVFPSGNYLIGNQEIRSIIIQGGAPFVDFCNATIVRSVSDFSGASVLFNDCKDLSIKNLRVRTKDNTIYGAAVRGLNVENLSMENIDIASQTPHDNTRPGNWGLTLSGKNIQLQGIVIDNYDIGLWGDGIHLGVVKNFTLENFRIFGGDDCISICQHAPYTGDWSEECSENIVIGNGVLASSAASAIRIESVPLSGHESDSDYQKHTVKNVLIHDVQFVEDNHIALQMVETRTTPKNSYDNIVFDSCMFLDDSSYSGNFIVGGSVSSPIKVGHLTFRNCSFERRNDNGVYGTFINVNDLEISNCSLYDTSFASTDFNITNCTNVKLLNNSIRQVASNDSAIVFFLKNIVTLQAAGNIAQNSKGSDSKLFSCSGMTGSSNLRFISNFVSGFGDAIVFSDSSNNLGGIVDIWNYWGNGSNALPSKSATAKVVAGKDSFLPLGGGTMSGKISRSGEALVAQGDAYYLAVCGGTGLGNGAAVVLSGKDRSDLSGKFSLKAQTASASKELSGYPSGTLAWDGQAMQVSSDARLKTALTAIPSTVLEAWGSVEWGGFKFLDSAAVKGDAARTHVGLIAQQVLRAFEDKGLDACQLGILCHEERESTANESAVDLWMVRYEEALALECAYQRWLGEQRDAKIKTLMQRISALENNQ